MRGVRDGARTPAAEDLVDVLARSGLTGRGGAAFPTATKVAAARERRARLVVNACDGEVGAAKDGWVVAHALEELLEGARLLERLLGRRPATWAAKRGSATESILRGAGLTVLAVPDRYVSSEESALVARAAGGLARPVTKHVPVVHGGRDPEGRRLPPTLVLNAETVWRVAQVERHGDGWFRSHGTPEEPGPQLVHVHGDVRHPGVVETAAGARLADLVEAAGGPTGPVVAVEVGGLSGGWLTRADAVAATWSSRGLAAHGLRTGPGVLRVVGADRCPLDEAERLVTWASGESAGQCGPCTFGVPHVASLLADVVHGRADARGLQRLRRDLGLLPGRGACRFPDGVAAYVASTVRTFPRELEAHLEGRCTARQVRASGSRRTNSAPA